MRNKYSIEKFQTVDRLESFLNANSESIVNYQIGVIDNVVFAVFEWKVQLEY